MKIGRRNQQKRGRGGRVGKPVCLLDFILFVIYFDKSWFCEYKSSPMNRNNRVIFNIYSHS